MTTNFDDFVSRALSLFGKGHVVCDHPATTARIDPESKDVQIVHVHGSYWFYDCCNLKGELSNRSKPSAESTNSMMALLDRILSNRSPIVIGYSGWENDVFMTSFKKRLAAPLGYNAYWYCHLGRSLKELPDWLKHHQNVFFIAPPATATDRFFQSAFETTVKEPLLTEEMQEMKGEKEREPTISAIQVIDSLMRKFNVETPQLTSDPLQFYADQLRHSLPQQSDSEGPTDFYSFPAVIAQIESAANWLRQESEPLKVVRDALSRSRYQEVVEEGRRLFNSGRLDNSKQLRELVGAIWVASLGLKDRNSELLEAYDLIIAAVESMERHNDLTADDEIQLARALVDKGTALVELNHREEAIAASDQVLARFGESSEPVFQEQVAWALANKAVALEALNRYEETIAVFDQVLARFGESPGRVFQGLTALALVFKGVALGKLNRHEEAIAASDRVLARFGQSSEPTVQDQVARAGVFKGTALEELNRHEEAIAAYDQVLARFGKSPGRLFQGLTARALVFKASALGKLNRYEDEIAVYDQVLARLGESTEPFFQEQVATALLNKGFALGKLNRYEEVIAACDQMRTRFGESPDPFLQVLTASALAAIAAALEKLSRHEEAIAAYDQVVARLGESTEPAFQGLTAWVLVFKGDLLGKLSRREEAIAIYDQVLARSGQSSELTLQEQVARARVGKDATLGELNRSGGETDSPINGEQSPGRTPNK